jgi:hypothetical protein
MAATTPRGRTDLTTDRRDTVAPWSRRAGRFLLRLLEEFGSQPSIWDPWLVLTLPVRRQAAGRPGPPGDRRGLRPERSHRDCPMTSPSRASG